MGDSLRIWFLASEVAPFSKTGGLADVAGSLPYALRKLGWDVRVGVPLHRMAREVTPAMEEVTGLEVPLADRIVPCRVLAARAEDGGIFYFFDRPDFFDRDYLYGTEEGDYPDNLERFAYFSRAALVFARTVGLDFDVVHCHDWQTGLVPAYLKTVYAHDPFFARTASVFTIHNVGYQGLFPAAQWPISGLPRSEFHPGAVEYWGQLSLLKAGIRYSDAITTVSPTYSREIQTPEFGLGMEGILHDRAADLFGILNGVDYGGWDPATDRFLKTPYSAGKLKGKGICKAWLLNEMGLDAGMRSRPLLAVISRLTKQKGYDLLLEAIDDILKMEAAVVILAAGERKYQEKLDASTRSNQGRMAVKIGFDEPLAHRIMAGADILLVPSRYEPCGLTQIYALKYGTVPVVRATGGLEDTIRQFDPASGEGTGFKFGPYEKGAFLEQIATAVETFSNKRVWNKIVRNGMAEDFSWQGSAREYLSLYGRVAGKGSK